MAGSEVTFDSQYEANKAQGFSLRQILAPIDPSNQLLGLEFPQNHYSRSPFIQESEPTFPARFWPIDMVHIFCTNSIVALNYIIQSDLG